jgi:triosephosphate isomerase
MCGYIRKVVASLHGDHVASQVVIQYGGSVKPENAGALLHMPEIDGALVGGASLDVESLLAIARA